LYVASVNHTLDDYRNLLRAVKENKLHLSNTDFDTGKPTRAGEYTLTDNAYARLLDQLSRNNFQQVTPELRQNILTFYADPNAPLATKRNADAWSKTQEQLARLKNSAPQPGLVPPISTAP